MSQVRDTSVPVTNGANQGLPTDPDNDVHGAQGAVPLTPGELTEAQVARRYEQRVQDRRDQHQDLQADFLKKTAAPQGYGSNESDDDKQVKQSVVAAGFQAPSASQVQVMHAAVGETKPFQEAVGAVKEALTGEGPVPTPERMTQLLGQTIDAGFTVRPQQGAIQMPAAHGTAVGAAQPQAAPAGAAAAVAGVGQAPSAQSLIVTQPPTAAGTAATPAAQVAGLTKSALEKATSAGADKKGSLLPVTTNVQALVMLVILQAQQQTTKEKNDVLRKIKMYNGMLDEVNKYVTKELMGAQKEMQDLKNAGKDKPGFKAENVQVTVNAMTGLDTDNASFNPATGSVVLNAQYGDGKTSSRQLVDSTALTNMISQADQWRTSIQNNQTRESNRFQAKDNQMSAAWNILNAVLKNTHEGVAAIVRNV